MLLQDRGKVWRERMMSVHELEALLSVVTFPPKLHDSDQFETDEGEAFRARTGLEAFSG
jgi:hypothetical protein